MSELERLFNRYKEIQKECAILPHLIQNCASIVQNEGVKFNRECAIDFKKSSEEFKKKMEIINQLMKSVESDVIDFVRSQINNEK